MFEPWPTYIGSLSALRTALNQTLASLAKITSPITLALGAIQKSSPDVCNFLSPRSLFIVCSK